MLSRFVSRPTWIVIVGAVWMGFASSAVALPISQVISGGIDDGQACQSTASSCFAERTFDVVPTADATGTVEVFGAGLFYTFDIHLAVASLTMEDAAGAFDGVDEIVFTNLTFDVTGWSAADFGGVGFATGMASPTGIVTGTYEQFSGGSSVVGPQNFVQPVQFTSLGCVTDGTGICGFSIGFGGPSLVLGVGTTGSGTDHEFEWTFNVAIPEPSTAALLSLGLVGLASVRRRRA